MARLMVLEGAHRGVGAAHLRGDAGISKDRPAAAAAERSPLSPLEDVVSLSPQAQALQHNGSVSATASASDDHDRASLASKTALPTETTEAAEKSDQELTTEEQETVEELKARDAEVRAHEQAHAQAGGALAGAPSFEYQTGPDGRRYAVGGEVSIDVSAVPDDPDATVAKMRTVRAAATAPVEPSSQDLAVLAEASRKLAQAQAEQTEESAEASPPGSGAPETAADSTPIQEGSAGRGAGDADASRPEAHADAAGDPTRLRAAQAYARAQGQSVGDDTSGGFQAAA